jgi:hypothetical protein
MLLRNEGDYTAAERLENTYRAEAPIAAVCTGGTCGLETVNVLTNEGQKIAKAVNAKVGDKVVRDTERKCPNPKCQKREIVYAFNDKEVKKKCLACGTHDYKMTAVRKAA